jgi:poly-gamma-glutamate synthesis protein (capsule biosynthesis protein)
VSKRRAVACLVALAVGCSVASAQPAGIYFRDACVAGERVTIAAVGDLLFHFNLQQQALARGGSFARFWEKLEHVFKRADVVYGNLEGPAARNVGPGGREGRDNGRASERIYDRRFYAGGEDDVLIFNFHPSAVPEVKAGGFHVLSTANNHSADRGPLGIERTIDALEDANVAFTGTRRRGESEHDRPWSTLTRANGFNIAWLACTYGLNGMPDPHGQVLACYGRRGEPRAEVLDAIRRLAAHPAIDAVMLTPHWGNEYQHQPSQQERRFAREAIEAGATAVIGAHPHVVQPWEKVTTPDGREGLIVYSLGNFISAQIGTPRRSALIALLELARAEDGKVRLTAAGYVPTWVEYGNPYRIVENTGTANLEAFNLTMRLLPRGNRVLSSEMQILPKACEVTVAEGTRLPEHVAANGDVAGSIAVAGPADVTRARPKQAARPKPGKSAASLGDVFRE